ncbi:MAG: excisionase family DNA-binding protein [candidate division Zixibacteria bacterium]|nr:excisionase family DNA-binding protein [candidate division Zixibacteria bacterium]
MAKDYLTTSQAAKKLSVSPDTVLKWVKAGKVRSHRTLGGHFRIPISIINKMIDEASGTAASEETPATANPTFQYCWEHQSKPGLLNEKCKECVVYRSRARRCYELRDLPEEFGSLMLYCTDTCEKCDYYKLVNNLGFNILIISNNDRLTADIDSSELSDNFQIEAVSNEYECASKIEKFRPDFIIVDCSMGAVKTRELCKHLGEDARIPFTRLILTSNKNQQGDFCDREIFGWIKKPFTMKKLRNCIEGIADIIPQIKVIE